MKSGLKERIKNWKIVGFMKIREEESFKQWLLMSGMTEVPNRVLTEHLTFNLGTRRPLVSSAIGNGLETGGHGLGMEAIEKTASRMI